MSTVGSFVRLWFLDGTSIQVVETEEPRIDAAVQLCHDSQGTRNVVLDLTAVHGGAFKVLASQVACWVVSTPETREAQRAWDLAMDEEETEFKHRNGWVESDD